MQAIRWWKTLLPKLAISGGLLGCDLSRWNLHGGDEILVLQAVPNEPSASPLSSFQYLLLKPGAVACDGTETGTLFSNHVCNAFRWGDGVNCEVASDPLRRKVRRMKSNIGNQYAKSSSVAPWHTTLYCQRSLK